MGSRRPIIIDRSGRRKNYWHGDQPVGSVLIYAGVKTDDAPARQGLEEAIGPDDRVAWFDANFQGWSEI